MGRKKKTAVNSVPYPCEIEVGDMLLTKDNQVRTIKSFDGRMIYFEDGSQYCLRHPDLLCKVIEEENKVEEESTVSE